MSIIFADFESDPRGGPTVFGVADLSGLES